MPGALLVGDADGTPNVPKIKGVHQAMRSGACGWHVETGMSEGHRWRYRTAVAACWFAICDRYGGLWPDCKRCAQTITGVTRRTLNNHADTRRVRLDQMSPPSAAGAEGHATG
jgi:electron-transferring-flavoprotein dehydrogenase